MASTFTPLGIELQATGENAGTWGTKTNTNLQLIEQIAGGFTTQAVSDSGDKTALSVSDGSKCRTCTQNYRIYRNIYRIQNCNYSNRCSRFLYFKKFNKWITKRSI